MDTQRLRQKILDLAIRGKLVEQDPNDEPASVLLGRIHAEKLAMVERGELKPKDVKGDSVIFLGEDNLHYEKIGDAEPVCIEDEIPFELPKGWMWARVGTLVSKLGAGSTPKGGSTNYQDSGIKFIRSQNVYNDGLRLEDVVYISESINKSKSGSIVKPGDLLLNITGGSIGRCALISDSFDIANVNQHVMIVRLVAPVAKRYIHACITSKYVQEQILKRQLGSGRGGLSAETFTTFLLPLPPHKECDRIVAALDEYLGLVDRIEQEEAELDELVAKAKAKVLDLAIRGKLVEQDPDDEPASVLLERIHAEKLAMVERGELPASAVKADTVIFHGDDNSYYEKDGKGTLSIIEVPFELPETWRWARLNTICTPMYKKTPQGDLFRYIDIDSIDNSRCAIKEPKIVPTSEAPSRASRGVQCGTVLFSMVRPYLRNIALVSYDLEDCIASTGFYTCNPVQGIDSQWLYCIMTSDYAVGFINSFMRGDNSPSVRKDDVDVLLVPIPPENEQMTIVERHKSLSDLFELF